MSGASPSLRFRIALILYAAAMVAFAAVGNLRLGNDCYQHFVHGVLPLRSGAWASLVLDVWNKPLVGLLYGIPGLAGYEAARLAAVACTLLAVVWTARAGRAWVGSERGLWAGLLFGCLLPVLKDGFVPMTEIPAAAALAGATLAHIRGRPIAAAIGLGLLPLLRTELVAMSAVLGVVLAWGDLRTGRLARVLGLAVIVAGPTAFWLGAGAWLSQDWGWFSRQSYAELRSFELSGLLAYNAVTRIARAVPSPMLVLLIWGSLRLARERPRGGAWIVAGTLVHLALISLVDVYPAGDGPVPDGHAVAAVNDRGFTPSGPFLALTALYGGLGPRSRTANWVAAFVAFALVLFAFGLRPDALLPALLVGMTAVASERIRTASQAGAWAGLALAGALAVRPLFFYPFRFQERSALAVRALADAVLDAESRPRMVIQDLASGLAADPRVLALPAPPSVEWTWPSSYPNALLSAAEGFEPAWVLFVLDGEGRLDPRYPDEVRARFETCPEVASYASEDHEGWVAMMDAISRRNRKVAWRACRVDP